LILRPVSVGFRRSDRLLKPLQQGKKIIEFLLHIFAVLGAYASVVYDNYPLDGYLVVLNERVHEA